MRYGTFELLDDPFAFYNLTGFLSERIEYGFSNLLVASCRHFNQRPNGTVARQLVRVGC